MVKKNERSCMHCSSCGGVLPPEARFCPQCGRQVKIPKDAYHPVTVVYVDIVGYTRMVRTLSPEDVATVTTRFFDLLEETVTEAGGILYQKLGDGALCVFGYPRVMEDAAVQALQACVRLTQRLPEVDPDLRVHGGVASGKVLVVPGPEVRFIGEPMNLAARLETRSKPGEFLVDVATRNRAAHAFTFTHGVTAEIPGFGPREVFILQTSREDARSWRKTSSRVFVGRERDLLALDRAWTRFIHEPHPTMVRIHGEAGIGKTRLLAEFLRRIPRNKVVIARALPFGMPPFGPLLLALRDALSSVPERIPSRLFGQNPDLAGELKTYARQLLPSEPEEALEVLVGMLSSLFFEPRLLVLDDAQWADEKTFQAIESLFHRAHPIFFLLSARPPDPGKPFFHATLSHLEREIPSSVIRLGPFTHEESWIFWESLHGKPPDEDVFERVFLRTGGVPLFVEEASRLIAEEGASSGVLPERLEDMIRARISQFPPECQNLLACASLLGPVFPPEPVRKALKLSEEVFRKTLAHLVRHGLLVRDDPSTGEDERYAFRHILFQEAVQASLPRDRLRTYAQALLKDLEGNATGVSAGLSRAQILARLAWLSGDGSRAARYLLEALREMERAGSWRQMLRLFGTFQDLENVPPELEQSLELLRVRALIRSGNLDEARRILENLEGDEARILRGEVLQAAGEYRKAFEYLRHVTIHDGRFHLRRNLMLLHLAAFQGDQQQVEALWQEITRISLPEDPVTRAELLLTRADTLPYERFKTRIRLYREILTLAEEHGLMGFAREARNALMELSYRGHIAEALSFVETALQDARASGDRDQEMRARYHRAIMYAQIGALDLAREDLQAYWTLGEKAGNRSIHIFGNWLRAFIAKTANEVDEMFAAFREASTWAWRLGKRDTREYFMDDFAHALMEHGHSVGLALARRFSRTWPLYRRLFFVWRWDLEPVDWRDIFRHAPPHLSWGEWLHLMTVVMEKDPRAHAALEWKARKIFGFVLSRTPEHLRHHLLRHPWYGFLAPPAA